MNPVFKIRELSCAYVENEPVLTFEKLEIPRGKLIFVIGKSGIGKSTFIETLGLMNNTIEKKEECSIAFFPKEAGPSIELSKAWEMNNTALSKFRKEYFSFVFQNTNLMPNFSAGQNMMISLLIQGVEKEVARKKVLSVMQKLSLPEEIFDKKITELSGGQRQRLAFVRSVTSDFSILFGDEPTGNLDENTADDLMKVLKSLIISDGKTGVIVSHDLRLAAKFGDLIIPIVIDFKEDGSFSGSIKEENILMKKSGEWLVNNSPIDEIEDHLVQYIR